MPITSHNKRTGFVNDIVDAAWKVAVETATRHGLTPPTKAAVRARFSRIAEQAQYADLSQMADDLLRPANARVTLTQAAERNVEKSNTQMQLDLSNMSQEDQIKALQKELRQERRKVAKLSRKATGQN